MYLYHDFKQVKHRIFCVASNLSLIIIALSNTSQVEEQDPYFLPSGSYLMMIVLSHRFEAAEHYPYFPPSCSCLMIVLIIHCSGAEERYPCVPPIFVPLMMTRNLLHGIITVLGNNSETEEQYPYFFASRQVISFKISVVY